MWPVVGLPGDRPDAPYGVRMLWSGLVLGVLALLNGRAVLDLSCSQIW